MSKEITVFVQTGENEYGDEEGYDEYVILEDDECLDIICRTLASGQVRKRTQPEIWKAIYNALHDFITSFDLYETIEDGFEEEFYTYAESQINRR